MFSEASRGLAHHLDGLRDVFCGGGFLVCFLRLHDLKDFLGDPFDVVFQQGSFGLLGHSCTRGPRREGRVEHHPQMRIPLRPGVGHLRYLALTLLFDLHESVDVEFMSV